MSFLLLSLSHKIIVITIIIVIDFRIKSLILINHYILSVKINPSSLAGKRVKKFEHSNNFSFDDPVGVVIIYLLEIIANVTIISI